MSKTLAVNIFFVKKHRRLAYPRATLKVFACD